MKTTQQIRRNDLQKLYTIACESWQKKIVEVALFNSGDEISIENSLIEKAYNAADDAQKKEIEKYFNIISNDVFSVTNYSEVCKRLNTKELSLVDFKEFGEDANKILNYHKIKNLEKFFNQDWKIDWKNKNQYKYYPYFTVNSSSRLVFYGVCYYCADIFCGLIGYYQNEKTAKHIGTYFIDIYEKLM